MRSEPMPRAKRYWVALLFLLLGTLVGVWHNHTLNAGKSDVVAGVVRGALSPPAVGLGRASQWVSDQTRWLFQGRSLADENHRLQGRVAALEGENALLREAQINHDRLRQDLGFVQVKSPRLLAADIIARRPDPKFDTLLLARGSQTGVHVGSVVVTRAGLVGRVYEVTPGTASVLMITDGNENSGGVGARVQRASSRAVGVCKGGSAGQLAMVYLSNDADIKPGDIIVTSGLGGVFPAGLLIGTVQAVKAEEGNRKKRAQVRPVVDFEKLEEVYVLQ